MSKLTLNYNQITESIAFDGIDRLCAVYTGGGIYVFRARLSDNLWMTADSECGVAFVDTMPDLDMSIDTDFFNAHTVYMPTENESRQSLIYFLNQFIEHNRNHNSDFIDYEDCNFSISDLITLLNGLDAIGEKTDPDYIVVGEIPVNGPIDALIEYFFDFAKNDIYLFGDPDEVPSNASMICEALGILTAKCNTDDNVVYVARCEDCGGERWWKVTENFGEIGQGPSLISCHKIVIDFSDPELFEIKPYKRFEFEENYCNHTDTTFVIKDEYIGESLESREVIGFYAGEPRRYYTTAIATGNYDHPLKVIYNRL